MKPGTRVSHYEILCAIGRGGMGEVWKARDTKLRREVALKTLPPEFAQDADRLARLEREATSLATLNHPNIASIYGIEEHAGNRFLVLELIEGRTLHDLLLTGALGVERSLKIALQIAEALEATHEKGVIHRDLKPANVKITPDDRVKILDFGLAKNLLPSAAPLPSETALHTEIGAIMGTPPYMSPEQARGDGIGRQTDIWSLGVMLYEMLTARLPFGGDTAAQTLARVLEAQPDYSSLPARTPASVRRLLGRCLEKDRRRRFQHAGDLRVDIEDALAAPGAEPAAGTRARLPRTAVGLGAALLGAIAAWSLGARYAAEAPGEPIRLSTSFPGQPNTLPFGTRHIAISDDGLRIAYASQSRLWIRPLRDSEAIAVDNPSAIGAVVNPFFSPNGEWVGFLYNGLMKVPSVGGIPTQIAATTERPAGATWGADGTIVFATTEGLYRVADSGGEPQLVVRPDPARNERLYAWPQFLPGERTLLFTIFPQRLTDPPQIAWLDLQTLESRIVATGGTAARYASTGHLVYAAGERLNAVRFDLADHATRGDAFPLPEIEVATTQDNGAADFALSATGTLVFVTPQANAAGEPARTLAWVDRQGIAEPLAMGAANYAYPRISPDGSLVALDMTRSGNRDVWMLDPRRVSLTRLTTGPTEDLMPLWSSDGRRVFFGSNRGGNFDVYSQPADGSSDARLEIAAPGFQTPQSATPDGTRLMIFENFRDLSVLDLERSTLTPLLHNEFEHGLSEVSPDGNWLAYESLESGGQLEVFVRPFPDVSARREKISADGGRYPKWGAPGSSELYYVAPDGSLMAAALQFTPDLRVGAVTKLFAVDAPTAWVSPRPFDVSPVDGRFLVTRAVTQPAESSTDVSVVLDWFSELRALTP